MSGLRLSDLNKETTYLLTYLLTYSSPPSAALVSTIPLISSASNSAAILFLLLTHTIISRKWQINPHSPVSVNGDLRALGTCMTKQYALVYFSK